MRYVTSLWWCKIFHKGDIFDQLENLTNFEISCMLEKISNFFPVSSFRNCQNFPTQEVSTLSKPRTSMQSWLRTTAATEWFAGYLINTQSQLICIIIAQPHPEPACNDDTCQPHNTLDMLFNLSFKLVLIEASDIRLRRTSWWQQARQFDIVGSEQRSVADQWQDRIV